MFRAGLVLLALLLLILPLRSLTNRRAQVISPATPPASAAKVDLTITCTSYPFQFEISHLGKTIWKGESLTSSSSETVALAFPPQGIDLTVRAFWAEPSEAAVRLDLARSDETPIAKTLWGTGKVNDVVTFAASP